MHYKIFLTLVWLATSVICKSQDTILKSSTTQIGIYLKWEDFKLSKPSISNPFRMIQHTYINEDNVDSFKYNYYCKFDDSTFSLKSAFGVFDGKSLYIFNRKNNDTLLFFRAKYAGKFPYLVYNYREGIVGGNLLTLTATAVNAAVSKPKRGILYFNAKGKVIFAQTQAVGFLIRKEPDFSEEWLNEKAITSEVLEKYIIKMNLRYPL